MKHFLCLAIRFYQRFLGPLLKGIVTGNPQGSICRFEPTCSHYCLEAVRKYGAVKGSWFGMRRILRCHPWGGCGYDPVPGTDSDPAPPSSTDEPEKRPLTNTPPRIRKHLFFF